MNNAKLNKYRAERESCMEKMAALQERVRELNRKIEDSENMEIRALMKDEKISLDELMAMLKDMQKKKRAAQSVAETEPVPAPMNEPVPAYETTKPEYWEETAE